MVQFVREPTPLLHLTLGAAFGNIATEMKEPLGGNCGRNVKLCPIGFHLAGGLPCGAHRSAAVHNALIGLVRSSCHESVVETCAHQERAT